MPAARTPRFFQLHASDPSAERAEVENGLIQRAATVSPKYFYDRLGSHLFEAITETPEYYPTRTEAAIFAAHGEEMARCIGIGTTFVDLGAGNCVKASRLFPLLEPSRYIAVDISVDFLHDALRRVQREHPTLDVVGLGQDFSSELRIDPSLLGEQTVCFYPGSSIGNFTPEEAMEFLKRVHAQTRGGGLLIGVDLVKPRPVLQAAYDDALGVTAAFNLNILRQINRLLDSDFDPRDWRHVAFFNEDRSRIEMHLESRHDLTVHWPGKQRSFHEGERIHTENSCKYTVESFSHLLQQAGFGKPQHWTDANEWFGVFWAPAR